MSQLHEIIALLQRQIKLYVNANSDLYNYQFEKNSQENCIEAKRVSVYQLSSSKMENSKAIL